MFQVEITGGGGGGGEGHSQRYHISLSKKGGFAAASCLYVSVYPRPQNFMSQLEDFHEILFE
jgi:hypothetical protein